MQWNVCEQGTVIRPVTAASIRSRHTGHVGNSYVDDRGDPLRLIVDDTVSSVSIATDKMRTT